jgi:hypothetical protein
MLINEKKIGGGINMFNDAFLWYDKVSVVVIIFVLICGCILYIWTKYINYKANRYFEKKNKREIEETEE